MTLSSNEDANLIPAHPGPDSNPANGSLRSSQLNLSHASTPCSQRDVERLKYIPMHDKRALDHGKDVCGCADSVNVGVDDRFLIQTPKKLPIGAVYNQAFGISPTIWGRISHGSDTVDRPSPQSSNHVKHSQASVSDSGSEGVAMSFRQNEELVVATTLPWYSRTLAFFTIHGELSVAHMPEEFAFLHMRLQQEWSFDGAILVGLAALNTTMFAMTADSIFKVDSFARTAVAISSTACGLGIACDVWFLLRYSWVDSKTFIYRSRDVYGSYAFFSLSARMPTFCMLISSVSVMFFLGLISYDARPVCVIVVGALVILVMILQFVVYGAHRCATSALRFCRAGEIRDSQV